MVILKEHMQVDTWIGTERKGGGFIRKGPIFTGGGKDASFQSRPLKGRL
jgi:hypothetical protein